MVQPWEIEDGQDKNGSNGIQLLKWILGRALIVSVLGCHLESFVREQMLIS